MLVLTYSFSFLGGDILFRIYYVKLSIGISRIIRVVVKERFEMMRGLWRSMLVSLFPFFPFFFFFFGFLISHAFFSIIIKLFFSNRQDRQNNY